MLARNATTKELLGSLRIRKHENEYFQKLLKSSVTDVAKQHRQAQVQ